MDLFVLGLAIHLEIVDFQRSRVELYCTRPPQVIDLGPPEGCGHVPLPHTESHVTITVTSSTNSALVAAPPPRSISA
jgi:hypothetical protein